MLLDPAELSSREKYNFMISTILPRPIAWISTIDSAGKTNLAPFSYFTGVCTDPMTVIFCPVVNSKGEKKDTLRNLELVPEFGLSIVTNDNVKFANLTAQELVYGSSEYEKFGITEAPSKKIRPPVVKDSPVSYECKVKEIITVSDNPGGGYIVLGEVINLHLNEDLKTENYMINSDELKPVGRIDSNKFLGIEKVFSLPRDF